MSNHPGGNATKSRKMHNKKMVNDLVDRSRSWSRSNKTLTND
jgi:hypothetical protein